MTLVFGHGAVPFHCVVIRGAQRAEELFLYSIPQPQKNMIEIKKKLL